MRFESLDKIHLWKSLLPLMWKCRENDLGALFLLIFFLFSIGKMSFFFHCVPCNLNFDDEDAFKSHASRRNIVTSSHREGLIDSPAETPCNARVTCRSCLRSYEKIKGWKGDKNKPDRATKCVIFVILEEA